MLGINVFIFILSALDLYICFSNILKRGGKSLDMFRKCLWLQGVCLGWYGYISVIIIRSLRNTNVVHEVLTEVPKKMAVASEYVLSPISA